MTAYSIRCLFREQPRQMMILSTLIAVLAVVALMRISPAAARGAEQKCDDTAAFDSTVIWYTAPPTTNWPSGIARNPFLRSVPRHSEAASLHAEAPAPPKFRIGGIMLAENPRAIIDGMLVREGQSIDGYAVRKISRNLIIVARGGVEWELRPESP